MGSRIVMRGRAVWASRDLHRRKPRIVPPRDKFGAAVDINPIPANRAPSSFRDGVPWTDPDTGLVYRVIRKVRPEEGWATARFWLRRHRVSFDALAEWAQMGIMDAAIESGSATRWFRCRDEQRVRAWIAKHHPKRKL